MNDEYAEGILAAKVELESYSRAKQVYEDLNRRRNNIRWPSITSGSPSVGYRKGYRMVPVIAPSGKPTGRKRREYGLVPCPISVQTQPNPHQQEDAYAEHSYLSFECREQAERAGAIREKLTARIGAVRYPLNDILRLRYLEGLTLTQITQHMGLFYSYRQIKRIFSEAIEEYARIWGFIKQSCE